MHCDPRKARRYMARIRKELKKPKGEIVTLAEVCRAMPFTEKDVIPYLI
jgi:hypothetical protein